MCLLCHSLAVLHSVQEIRLTPTWTEDLLTVVVQGSPIASGSQSDAIPLTEGATTVIVMTITWNGGVATKYTVMVSRQGVASSGLSDLGCTMMPSGAACVLNPPFSPTLYAYEVSKAPCVYSIFRWA